MSTSNATGGRLLKQTLEYLSKESAARLAGLPDPRRVERNVRADAFELGPNGKRWPLYFRETVATWISDGMPTREGGEEL